MKKLILITVALMAAAVPVSAQVSGSGDGQIDAFVELLRSDIKTEKVAMINEVMDFNSEQSSIFWPIYREYELETSKVGDVQLNLIKDYARVFDKLTDMEAKELAKRSFKLEEDKVKLRKKYFEKFASKLGEAQAAKFAQLDRQISMLIDLQIATNLPLINVAPKEAPAAN